MIVRRAQATLAWCPDCCAEVDVIKVDNGSEPATGAQIARWIGTGKLHIWQPASGAAQICVTSLLQCFESEQAQRLFHLHQGSLDQSRKGKNETHYF
jgi:hypothetical protein